MEDPDWAFNAMDAFLSRSAPVKDEEWFELGTNDSGEFALTRVIELFEVVCLEIDE